MCYTSFVQDFHLKLTVSKVNACNSNWSYSKGYAGYLFILYHYRNYLPDCHCRTNCFHPELRHDLCTSISSWTKLIWLHSHHVAPQKWFPRWGIMSYKNIRLPLNMDTEEFCFEIAARWIGSLFPRVNQTSSAKWLLSKGHNQLSWVSSRAALL